MNSIKQDYKPTHKDYPLSPIAATLIVLAAFFLGMIYGVQI